MKDVGIVSIIVAITSIFISVITYWSQRKHNKLSFKPIPFIKIGKYEHDIFVELYNYGTGPLIITNLKATYKNKKSYNTLIQCVQSEIYYNYWTDFAEDIVKRPVPPNGKIVLIRLKPRLNNTNDIKQREALCNTLKEITIIIQSKDIYQKKQPEYKRNLALF